MSERRVLTETAKRWDERYRQLDTPWDLDGASPVVQRLASRLLSPGARVLVPGCGLGHDAAALAQRGIRVVGLDLSPTAVARASERHAGVPGLEFHLGNFFEVGTTLGRFDAVIEHTCYCAVGPELNPAYVNAAAELLHPGGLVFGAFLNFEGGGPPYGTDPDTLHRLFSRQFETVELNAVDETFSPRSFPQMEAVFRLQS